MTYKTRRTEPITNLTRCLCTSLVLLLGPLPLLGQEGAPGFQSTFHSEWVEGRQRVESIASAIPEATYGWRPGEGVRSTGCWSAKQDLCDTYRH